MTALSIPTNASLGDLDWIFDPSGDRPVGVRRSRDGKQWPLADPDAIGGGGASTGHLGTVASEAAMIALEAAVGSTALRSDVGAFGTMYELWQLPASTNTNWQALAGLIANGTPIVVRVLRQNMPYQLVVWVAAGCTVTVNDGTATYTLFESTDPHVVSVFEKPGVSPITTLTITRTAGAAATSAYSLEKA